MKNNFKDLTGLVFWQLTVTDISLERTRCGTYWNCTCSCGGKKAVRSDHLINGKTKSCGCLRKSSSIRKKIPPFINDLQVIREIEPTITKSVIKSRRLLLKCFCGVEFIANKGNITRGHTRSCGCLQPPGYHGMRGTPIYKVWDGMMQRCYNLKTKAYKNYGGKGVVVCELWHTFINFYNWAVNNGHKNGLQLDKDKLAPSETGLLYCPEYCCFLTRKENNRHKSTNIKYLHNGVMKTIIELSEISGINYETLRNRLKKWSVDDALTKPIKK